MKFVLSVLNQGLSNTDDLLKLSSPSHYMYNKLMMKKNDFESSINFLHGGGLNYTPDYSISRLKCQLNWLRYDENLHRDDINEVNECIKKLTYGAKTLSD